MAKEKKEGVLSRWFRQRSEDREAEEEAKKESAGSFGSAPQKDPTPAWSAVGDQREKLAQAEADAKSEAAKAKAEAEKLEAKMEAQKEKARKELEEAKARVEKAKLKAKAKMELEEQQKKLEEARAKIKAAKKRTYTVKPGDSLSAIAKEVYGNANKWPQIYEANKEIIGDNPNLIHPGQEFVIPEED